MAVILTPFLMLRLPGRGEERRALTSCWYFARMSLPAEPADCRDPPVLDAVLLFVFTPRGRVLGWASAGVSMPPLLVPTIFRF